MIRRILLAAVLAFAPILVASDHASGGGGCTEVTSGTGAKVGLKDICVYPTLIRLPSGAGAVTFTNYDAVDHVIVGAGLAWSSGGVMHQFDSFTVHFDRDGVYPFQCYIHPGMSGAVLVGDADGRGAATREGVTLGGGSDGPPPSMAAAPATQAEQTSDRGGWWGAGVAAFTLVVVLLVRRRSRVTSSTAGGQPAGS
jgi:plastocyanin